MVLHKIYELPDSFLATQGSLLGDIQKRIPHGWLNAIVGIMMDTNGSGAMPEPG